MKIKRKNIFCRFIVLVKSLVVSRGRVRTMRNVKEQKTKIRNVINGDDHQRRFTTPISMSM